MLWISKLSNLDYLNFKMYLSNTIVFLMHLAFLTPPCNYFPNVNSIQTIRNG